MMDRRGFLSATAACALTAKARSYERILGANDRVHVAVAGVNNRGQAHMTTLARLPSGSVDRLIDVDSQVLNHRIG